MSRVSYDRLKSLLVYSPETGEWRWLVNCGTARQGQIAGGPHCKGYWRLCIDRKSYLSHQLAWFYMTGEWADPEVDHQDHDRSNNRWINLRKATRSQNLANQVLSRRNTSGHKGVSFEKNTGRWLAKIGQKRIGTFDDKESARQAYLFAAKVIFGEFAYPGVP